MRVGVVGVGRLGSLFARALADHPDVDGLALAGSRPGSARGLADELDATAFDDASDVFESVDAVVIAASTSAHASLVGQAASAGIPAFCEKPLALDLPSTDRMVGQVDAAGTDLQVGFQRRFDPGYRKAMELVQSGALGDIYLVRAASHDPAPSPPEFIATSGDLYLDLVIHDFDAVRFVTGQQIVTVAATGHAEFENFGSYRSHDDFGVGAGTLELSRGTLVAFTATRHNPAGYDIRMEIVGSKGSVVVGWDDRTPLQSTEPGVQPLPGPPYGDFLDRFAPAYRAEMDAFVDLAHGRIENPCTPVEARAAFVAALAASRSTREGRPVALAEFE
jgi:myo-inositol 2-dehydrogenase/D-chiro-inositol 1-dehydrogenase